MTEDPERAMPEGEIGQQDEGEDVEAHKVHEKVQEAAAMEEGPDVEGHKFHPKAHPKAQP